MRLPATARGRPRPFPITAPTEVTGLPPRASATSARAGVQDPLARLAIGEPVTSALLTLFLIPTPNAKLAGDHRHAA